MASNHWTTDPEYIDLLNYLIEKTENVKSPMSILRMAGEFKEKSGAAQTKHCLERRIFLFRTRIHIFAHLDTKTKVKLLFALSASVDANFLKKLKKDAVVEIDEKKRITHYEANDGSLELQGDQSLSARGRTAKDESKWSHRSLIIDYFENKSNIDTVPKNEKEKEMGKLIEFITEKCVSVSSPLNLTQLATDFNQHFGIVRDVGTIGYRIRKYCCEIQKAEFLDTQTRIEQLFGLGGRLDSDFLKELRKNAIVDVDKRNRITKYKANDGSLTLQGGHWGPKKTKRRRVEKTDKKNVAATTDDSGEESDIEGLDDSSDEYSSEEFDSEFDSDDENNHLDESEDHTEPSNTMNDFDNKTPVRSRSGMSNDNNFDFDLPSKRSYTPEDTGIRDDEEKENDPEITDKAGIKTRYGRMSKRRCPDLKDDSDSDSENGNDDLDKPESAVEPLSEAVDSNNETPARNHSSTCMSIDDNFDFDLSSERSHRSEEIEVRKDEKNDSALTGHAAVKTRSFPIETLRKSTSSTSHTPKTSKRKANASVVRSSTKRAKPLLEKSMNPLEMDDNISYDDLSRVELELFSEPRRLSNGIEKDTDIQQIPKPHPQVMEVPIKKEYEEEAQTSLKMILSDFKSLILSLDTPGLTQFQVELDTKSGEAGKGVEVSNKEVILAMKFLIVKLSKHGALESTEDSISLRDILLMLRTIILNSGFNGLELILEMLKENIEKLKVLDKKVPVSKVDCVLRATLDNICN